jgi:SAM-dependent methyltransferase
VDALYADGRHYDLLYPGAGADIDFVLREAAKRPGPVLELACGTGRFVVPLARAGHDVVGLDSSPPMLDEARRKASALGLAPRLVAGDMRDFDLDVRPSLIFIAGNSICHLLTNDDVGACFSCVRRHLAVGGRFLIDVFVPDPTLLARPSDTRFPYGAYDDPEGRRVELTCTVRYEPTTQINDVRIFRTSKGGDHEAVGSLRLRMFHPQELRVLLAHHGFRVDETFGDFRETPFGPGSTKQLVISSPTGPPPGP